jgi:hypothetical protein
VKLARILTRAALLASAAGILAGVGATAASAATPSAGSNAIEPSVKLFGPKFVLDARGGGSGYQHQQVILWQKSNADKAQDFTPLREGTVQDFRDAGLVSAAFNLHYGGLRAYELEYTPLGEGSGLCVGTWPGQVPVAGYKLRLEPCGEGASTVLAISRDAGNQLRYANVLDAAGSNFSKPVAWSWLNTDTVPQDYPRPVLGVQNLGSFSDGTHPYAQQWTAHRGVVGDPVTVTP